MENDDVISERIFDRVDVQFSKFFRQFFLFQEVFSPENTCVLCSARDEKEHDDRSYTSGII